MKPPMAVADTTPSAHRMIRIIAIVINIRLVSMGGSSVVVVALS